MQNAKCMRKFVYFSSVVLAAIIIVHSSQVQKL